MSLNVLRKVVSALHSAQFVSIMLDETTDGSNTKQVVICLHWVDSGLEAHEEFAGLYQVPNTEASTLFMVARDVMSQLKHHPWLAPNQVLPHLFKKKNLEQCSCTLMDMH